MEDIDMAELKVRGPSNRTEELRIELCDKVNALGIGAQGLGGLTTVLDVKIAMAPTHAARKPVAMIPNCAATRHAHFALDGSARSISIRRRSTSGPTCTGRPTTSVPQRRPRPLTREEVASWKPGDTLLLSGRC
jgi:fumarate hydratase class I